MTMIGYSFDVRRMQTHDGPGIRTTVFMKGCSLHCAWCHNPESISIDAEIWWQSSRSIGCGQCVDACPVGAISAEEGIVIDRGKCTNCMECTRICPSKALEAIRSEWTVDSLFADIDRDKAFLMNGGGVTISGGEPALQHPFVSELLERCQSAGYHTALDTCGAASRSAFRSLVPHCDLILFDLKIMDSAAHHKWTGQDPVRILENLRYTAKLVNSERTLWIRTPLIPGATATVENVEAIGRFIREEIPGAVERWELCAFNNLCADKYTRLGREWSMADTELLTRSEGQALLDAARRSSGLPEQSVILKGRLGA